MLSLSTGGRRKSKFVLSRFDRSFNNYWPIKRVPIELSKQHVAEEVVPTLEDNILHQLRLQPICLKVSYRIS